MRYTIQPVTLTGKLMGHTCGLYDDAQQARDVLLDAGYHETDTHSKVFRNTLKGGCMYHITMITENAL